MTQILVNILLPLILAPLLLGVINRTKAVLAGRTGQPLLQLYFDLWKLLHKGAVYSRTTSWVFRAGPMVGLAAILTASAIVPLGETSAPLHFAGDLILLAYLLGLARFFTVIAALDTGSAFEGMGASREVTFSALAEPAFLLGLAALARLTDNLSLTGILGGLTWHTWAASAPELAMAAAAMLIVFLAENARIPVDDPNTHLELTMIHEVMVLDHSGPDFAFILYGSSVKMWVLGAILVQAVLPASSAGYEARLAICLAGMFALAVLVGVIESVMARLRMIRVPQLLVAAIAFSLLAIILVLRRP
ncbi:MAG: NADH-quinone oxidoreductase subunit H [Planctomycetes bacterium]|nr:NADH-quinone oxidoreductase subunit H [Planctomycetota bacterium]